MTAVKPANLVVYRGDPEFRFDVDGEPFPWLIGEPGPRFVRHGDAVLVTLDIIPLRPDTRDWLPFSHTYGEIGEIGGRPFPWAIVGEVVYSHHFDDVPKLTLTFVAEVVDADCDIPEEAPAAPKETEEHLTKHPVIG